MAVAIAAVLAADAAVAFERMTQRDLTAALAGVISDARHAAAEAIRPTARESLASPAHGSRPGSSPSTPSGNGTGGAAGSSGTASTTRAGRSSAGGPATPSTGKSSPKKTSPGWKPIAAPAGMTASSPGPGAQATAPGSSSPPPSVPLSTAGTTPPTMTTGDVSDPPVPAPAANPLPELVRRLGLFVEQTRSLQFKVAVQVRVLPDAEFKVRYDEHVNLPSAQQASMKQAAFRALGIIGPGVDLAKEMTRLAAGLMPPSFYDPKVDEVLVQEGDIDAYRASMLVRALAEALDDQWFEVNRPSLGPALDPAADAFAGLVEGAARLVSAAYESSLPAEQQAEIKAERTRRAGLVPKDIPSAITAAYGLPAKAGPALAAALVKAGGQARLNAAFASPPATTEHLLSPSKYLAGEGAKPVTAPAADGAVITRGTLGQMGLLLMLSGVAPNDQVSQAAKGWGGDQYVAWQKGQQFCVRALVQMDSPEDDNQLVGVLGQWATKRGGVVEGSEPITFTRCA